MPPATPVGVMVTNPLTDTDLVVSWQNAITPVLGYNVYRGLSREGPLVKLNVTPIVVTFFDDNTAVQQSRTDYWYAVTAVDVTGESPQSIPVNQNPEARFDDRKTLVRAGDMVEMNHVAVLAEGVRRNEILLRRGGEAVDVYIRRTAGVRCSCFDPVRGQPKFANCGDCFGTTFEGGYDKYANVLMKIEPFQQQVQLTEIGVKVVSGPRAWITCFPIVKPGDIVARRINNRRYEVQNLDTKISRAIITRQEFTLNEMTPTEAPEIFMLS
jgi:hypothetical protein